MNYKVEPCVSDSCIKNEKDEIVLIVNSRANALTICEILNLDENHENGILAPIVWESQKVKETAEKILNELYVQFSADYLVGLRNEYKDWKYADLIKRYAKQFGVEIKEN